MCDYSLENIRTRPARTGERYETIRFATGSIGFAAPGDCQTAVCVPHDTRLRLEGVPESLMRPYGVDATEDVDFVRLERGPYHDGVRFGNGIEVTLQVLGPGVSATIVRPIESVPAERALVEAG